MSPLYNTVTALGDLLPTGVTYQNMPRATAGSTSGSLNTGEMRLTAIWLPAGFTVTSISFCSGSTALNATGSPHFWVALYNSSRALLRQSTDDTAPTWAANTLKTTNLSSTYTTTYTGLHYCGVMVVTGAATPTLVGSAQGSGAQALTPTFCGASSSSLTTTAPDPAASITAISTALWCGVA